MPLSIQIASDLHVEFWEQKSKFNFLKPSAPILALLGDICCTATESDFNNFKKFINEILPLYEHIILVPGNHEYYCTDNNPTEESTFDACNKKIKAFFKQPKLHYLNNGKITLNVEDEIYTIIGSTLWTSIPEEKYQMAVDKINDYEYIYQTVDSKISPHFINSLYLKNLRYLKSQITRARNTKIIVLTHHKPYIGNIKENDRSFVYESDVSFLIHEPVILWAYGHTHIKDDTIINNIRIVSNPKGYPHQRTRFDNKFSVTV